MAALAQAAKAWAPPRREPPSNWIAREYVISAEESAEPGRYSFARYAYLRDVFDWFADPAIEMNALPKAAQTGWTAGFTGLLCSLIDNDPSRILVALPTQDEAEIWAKDRFEPNVRATPALRAKVAASKSRDGQNTIRHKRFAGGTLKIVGANSSTGLSSWPAKYAFCDEVDRYPLSAGGEGDPIALVRKRLQTWLSRGGKIGLGSTPKVEQTSIIWHYYLQGDQRRWHCDCPHCQAEQLLDWEHVKWDAGRPREAAYHCPHCGAAWTDLDRLIAVAGGRWKATAEPSDPKIRSALIDGLLSPHVTVVEMATAWEACETDEQKQAFTNLYLGRPWRVVGEAPDWQRLYDRREDWPPNRLPADVLFLTIGADVQKDRIEARIWGWGRGRQAWLIDRRILLGDPHRDEVWQQMDALVGESWTHESGAEIAIARTAIDSGYATEEVYRWAKKHGRGRVIAVDGRASLQQAVGNMVVRLTVGRRKRRSGARIFPVGVSHIKDILYGWLRNDAPIDGKPYPNGYIHLPRHTADENEIRQLTAEELVTERNKMGFAVPAWKLIAGRRNEALDCAVYAYAAADDFGLEKRGEAWWASLSAALSNQLATPPADSAQPIVTVEPPAADRAEPEQPIVTRKPPPAAPRKPALIGKPRPGGWLGRR